MFYNSFSPYNTMPQIPQPQPQPQASGINAKVVNDFSEVLPNDVPMNGGFGLFAKADGSEIQLRRWNGNGLIDTNVYKPIVVPKVETKTMDIDVSKRFDDLEKQLEELTKKVDSIKPTSKARKEVADE